MKRYKGIVKGHTVVLWMTSVTDNEGSCKRIPSMTVTNPFQQGRPA